MPADPVARTNVAELYFRSSPYLFWRWEDRGDVVAWSGHGTLAFRNEIHSYLEGLENNGVPVFEALLLVLGAMQPDWSDLSLDLEVLDRQFDSRLRDQSGLFAAVRQGLDRIHAHCTRGALGHADKRAVMQCVFEAVSPAGLEMVAPVLMEQLRHGFHPNLVHDWQTKGSSIARAEASWTAALATLREAFANLDLDRLDHELRRMTGLSSPPRPAAPEMPAALRARALIADLEADREHAAFARLARSIMAMAGLPKRLAPREEMHTGGVSDITNRGALDRLLLSELAQDFDVLAARLVMNEALFIRRESPPQSVSPHRAVCVESGIRMWGRSRVFAAAVGLALCALADRKGEVTCFAAHGDAVEPTDLTNRKGLLRHLSLLHADPHPGGALPALEESLGRLAGAVESVLVLHADTFRDPGFQELWIRRGLETTYVMTVEGDGRLVLFECSRKGRKLLREATLDLEELLEQPSASPALLDDTGDLPVILTLQPFPLRMPCRSLSVEGVAQSSARVIAAVSKKQVMVNTDPALGWMEVGELKSGDTVRALDIRDSGRVRVFSYSKKFSRGAVEVFPAWRTNQRVVQLKGEIAGVVRAAFVDEVLFLYGASSIQVFDCNSGECLVQERFPPGYVRVRDDYFKTRGERTEWYRLRFDGQRLQYDCLQFALMQVPDLAQLCRIRDTGVLWGVDNTGRVYNFQTQTLIGKPIPPKPILDIFRVSYDGRRALIRTDLKNGSFYGVTPEGQHPRILYGKNQAESFLEPEIAQAIRDTCQLRTNVRKIQAIAKDEKGNLMLVLSGSGAAIVLMTDIYNRMRWVRHSYRKPERSFRFEEASRKRKQRVQLRVAECANRCRAWLDSRGFLHLQSRDAVIPQISLVLDEGMEAGWNSLGRTFGHPYYTGTPESVGPTDFLSHVKDFVERAL